MISFALMLMTLPSRMAEIRAARAKLSAKGAATSLSGEHTRPRVLAMAPSPSQTFSSSEHCGEAPQWAREGACAPPIESRFQRWRSDIGLNPGAMPQAIDETAPLALNAEADKPK